MKYNVIKMSGLGNRFIIFDARQKALQLSLSDIQHIAAKEHALGGCDQIIVLEPSVEAELFMRIYNADGSEVDACGNATRCVAKIVAEELKKNAVNISTGAGILHAQITGKNEVSVDMGPPRLEWNEIPLAKKQDTLQVNIASGPLKNPVAVSMGNPHIVFFVPDTEAVALDKHGPELEHHALFPERVNVGIAQILARDSIKLRVWERGAGETLACGTGACAALIAAARRGLTDRAAQVKVRGGQLYISWQENGHVLMRGAVSAPEYAELAIP